MQRQEDSKKPDSVLESTVDAAEWKLEVERVLPMLKVHIRGDIKVMGFLIYEYLPSQILSLLRLWLHLSFCGDCSFYIQRKDWRNHHEQMQQHSEGIKTTLSETKVSSYKM